MITVGATLRNQLTDIDSELQAHAREMKMLKHIFTNKIGCRIFSNRRIGTKDHNTGGQELFVAEGTSDGAVLEIEGAQFDDPYCSISLIKGGTISLEFGKDLNILLTDGTAEDFINEIISFVEGLICLLPKIKASDKIRFIIDEERKNDEK